MNGRRQERGRAAPAGQALTDFALVSLLLLAMLVLIFEGGLLAGNWFALGNAAREGVRAGSRPEAGDAEILVAVNRATTTFSGGYASVTANTPPDGCTAPHAVCVCRHPAGGARCRDTAVAGDLLDVTVRHRFSFFPFAGGILGQNAGVDLIAQEQARVD